jgi:hypothetical protein
VKLHYLSVASVALLLSSTICSTSYSSDSNIDGNPDEAGPAYFSALPLDVITRVSDFLPLEDARSFSETSKKNNRAVFRNKSWNFLKANNIQSRGIPMPMIVQSKLLLLDYMQADKASNFIVARKCVEQACELGDSRAIELMFWVLANGYNGIAGDPDKAEAFLDGWIEKGYSRAIRLYRDILLGNNQLFEADHEQAQKANEFLITTGNSWEARRFKRGHLWDGSQVYPQDQAGWKQLTDELAEHGDQYALMDKFKGLLFGSNGYECNVDAAGVILQKIPATYENMQSIATLRDQHISTAETPTRNKIIHMLSDWLIWNRHPRATFSKLQGLLFGLDGYERNLDAARAFLRGGSDNADDHKKAVKEASKSEAQALLDSLLKDPETPDRDAAIRLINDWLAETGDHSALERKYLGSVTGQHGYEKNLGELRLLLSLPIDDTVLLFGIHRELFQLEPNWDRDIAIRLINDWMFENLKTRLQSKDHAINIKVRGLLLGVCGYDRNLDEARQVLEPLCFDNSDYDIRVSCKHYMKQLVADLRQQEPTTESAEVIQLLTDWLFRVGDAETVHFRMTGLLLGENGFELNHEEAIRAIDSLSGDAMRELSELYRGLEWQARQPDASMEVVKAAELLQSWLGRKGSWQALQDKFMGLIPSENSRVEDFAQFKAELALLHRNDKSTVSYIADYLSREVKTIEGRMACRLLNDWLVNHNHYGAVFDKLKSLLDGQGAYDFNLHAALQLMNSINVSSGLIMNYQFDAWAKEEVTLNKLTAMRVLIDWYASKGNACAITFKCKSILTGKNGYACDFQEAKSLLKQLSESEYKADLHWVQQLQRDLTNAVQSPRSTELIRFLNDWRLEFGGEYDQLDATKFKILELLYGGQVYERNIDEAKKLLGSLKDVSRISITDFCPRWGNETLADLDVAPFVMAVLMRDKLSQSRKFYDVIGVPMISNRFLGLIQGINGYPQDLSKAIEFFAAYGIGLVDPSVLFEGYLALPQQPHAAELGALIVERMRGLNIDRKEIEFKFTSLLCQWTVGGNDAAYRLARLMGFVPKELL